MPERLELQNRLSRNRTCAAFSLLEIVVVLALIGAFIKLLIPNVAEFKSRLANRQSQLFYATLKEAAVAGNKSIIIFNQEGRATLPNAVAGEPITVPENMHLSYFMRLPTADNHTITALEVTHVRGSASYRQVTYDDQVLEQVVMR